MESATIDSMCRCCAAEGIFKDIKTSYHWMGDEEVYGDMLRECFDVKVSPVKAPQSPHKLYRLKQQPLKKKGYS